MTLHNLACLNYVEMLEYAENPPDSGDSMREIEQQLDQVEQKKQQERNEQARISEEIQMQEREKKYKESVKQIKH